MTVTVTVISAFKKPEVIDFSSWGHMALEQANAYAKAMRDLYQYKCIVEQSE